MATYTTNLNLAKPAYEDAADIDVLNTNMDKIDTAVGGKKSAQTAKSDPSASGTTLDFIATLSQNTNGEVTATKKTVKDMTGATGSSAGAHGLVPAPAAGDNTKVLQGDGSWVAQNKTGSSDSSSKLFLVGATSQSASAQTYSHDTAYVGTNGELYSGGSKVAHDEDVVKLTGNQSVAGVKSFTDTTQSSSKTTGAVKISGGLGVAKNIYADKVYNAVWNDYAECRECKPVLPGSVVRATISGVMEITEERLMPACRVVSDTFGHCMGETDKAKTPVAVAGRVLARPYRARNKYKIGDAVCSAPHGTVDIMSRREIRKYPDRIIGIVNEIPVYEKWGENGEVSVNGRIWIEVR